MKKLLLLFILIPFFSFSQVQIGQIINGEFSGDAFGASVSLSNDGNIIAIGATHSDENGFASGHVAIYENQSNTWVQLGNDIVGEAAGDAFGASVSLSGDGSIVAIGTPNNNGNGSSSGHVRIYENLSGTWTQIGSDIDGEAANDQSGSAISLSDDGNTIAIGAYTNDGNGYGSGHVRIYENQSGVWTQIGSDIDGEATNDESGWSLSLSSDGSIVAIAARWNSGIVHYSGQVRVYENQSGVWTQIGSDIDGEILGNQLGQSVSLSGDGTLLCVSGIEESMQSAAGYGFIRVYENQSGVWTKIGNDIQQENEQEYNYGSRVSMSDNGNVFAFTSSLSFGLVHIYTLESGVFVPLTTIQNLGSLSNQVSSISLSDDGIKIAIGDNYGSSNGNVKVFDLSQQLSMDKQAILHFKLYPNPTKTQFKIQLENTTELQNVAIYNNLGQQVLTSRKSVINTSKLASGLYLVEIKTNKGKASEKLIID